MIFVDTNFFLRFLLGDIKDQHDEAKNFFLKASESEYELFTSLIVVFEVYWVIFGQFKKEKDKICKVLNKLLGMKFIEFDDLDLIKQAIEVYSKTNLDLEDSYNLVYAKSKGASTFKTFDKILAKKLLN